MTVVFFALPSAQLKHTATWLPYAACERHQILCEKSGVKVVKVRLLLIYAIICMCCLYVCACVCICVRACLLWHIFFLLTVFAFGFRHYVELCFLYCRQIQIDVCIALLTCGRNVILCTHTHIYIYMKTHT